jgi:hypothetical protein
MTISSRGGKRVPQYSRTKMSKRGLNHQDEQVYGQTRNKHPLLGHAATLIKRNEEDPIKIDFWNSFDGVYKQNPLKM